MTLTRRQFLQSTAALATASSVGAAAPPPRRETRGVVLLPFDLTLADWPERARDAGLNTIGLHAVFRLDVLREFITGPAGQRFLKRCAALEIGLEYELHAMGELLSREYRHKDLNLFRMDEQGRRNTDANCCPHSAAALDIIGDKAVEWAKVFSPTTHRYFYWPDDGKQWCHCAKCRDYSASEQALLVENHILRALRSHDSHATLAHISYHYTLAAPVKVRPAPGIFLEFAPICRDYTKSIADRAAATRRPPGAHPDPATNGGYFEILQSNLKVFGADTAQALEYWLDVSRFSGWKRPVQKLPWNAKVCRADVAAYRALGVRHITTFATYIDAEYVKLHGKPWPAVNEYGAALKQP